MQSSDVSANLELDLGSDHRNISASISNNRSMEVWKTKKFSFKEWKPFLDGSGTAATYHSHLQKLRQECPPTSLRELGHIDVQAAGPSGSRL